MHFPLKPLSIVFIPCRKDIPAPATFESILELASVYIAIRIMILTQPLHTPQPPLTLVPLFGIDLHFPFAITMPIVKIPLINFSIPKLIHSLTELGPIHELSIEHIPIFLIELLPPTMLQVLRPKTLVNVPVLLVLVPALTLGCELVDVSDEVTSRFEDENAVRGAVLEEMAQEVLFGWETDEEKTREGFLLWVGLERTLA
jgi:hypothetical protein